MVELGQHCFIFLVWAQNGKLIFFTSGHDIILQDFMEGLFVCMSSDLSVSIVKAKSNNQGLQIQIHIPYETDAKHLTKSHDKELRSMHGFRRLRFAEVKGFAHGY